MSTDELFLELSAVTGLDRARWEEILSLPPDLQVLILDNYRSQDWADPGTPAFTRVLEVLGIIGTVAGVAGGVFGATSAARALSRS